MQIHGDYKGWYHRDDIAHYARLQREASNYSDERIGFRE